MAVNSVNQGQNVTDNVNMEEGVEALIAENVNLRQQLGELQNKLNQLLAAGTTVSVPAPNPSNPVQAPMPPLNMVQVPPSNMVQVPPSTTTPVPPSTTAPVAPSTTVPGQGKWQRNHQRYNPYWRGRGGRGGRGGGNVYNFY